LLKNISLETVASINATKNKSSKILQNLFINQQGCVDPWLRPLRGTTQSTRLKAI